MIEISGNAAKTAAALEAGRVVAVVTDTVWGLAARLDRPGAVDAVFELKGRDFNQPLAVLVPDPDRALGLEVDFPAPALELAREFWPGALTLIVTASEPLAAAVHAQKPSIGLRMPDHPKTLELLELTGPIAATSANPSGEPALGSAAEIAARFGHGVGFILDGEPAPNGLASTVIDCTTQPLTIIREGPLGPELLRSRGRWFGP